MRRLAFLLVGFFLAGPFTMSSDAWAWGDQGHKVICEIAFRQVQPNTRAEIQKLISTDDRFTTPAPGPIIHGKGQASIS
jgi:hypothetical protein